MDYRFWGYQSWRHTGSVGIGFGSLKSLVSLKKPIYCDKEKKKYFKSLGIDHTRIIGPSMYGKIHYSYLFGK